MCNKVTDLLNKVLTEVLGVWVIQPPASDPHIRPSALGPHKIFIHLNHQLLKVQSL